MDICSSFFLFHFGFLSQILALKNNRLKPQNATSCNKAGIMFVLFIAHCYSLHEKSVPYLYIGSVRCAWINPWNNKAKNNLVSQSYSLIKLCWFTVRTDTNSEKKSKQNEKVLDQFRFLNFYTQCRRAGTILWQSFNTRAKL